MKANDVLYQYKEKKMEPFGWILTAYVITILLLLSIFMIIGPIKTIMENLNVWTAILLLFIPLGGWLGFKILSYSRGVIWKNNHLTTFKFYRDTIKMNIWRNLYDREPTEEQIELSSIQKVVVAPYIANEYRTKHGSKHIDINYILYIIHKESNNNELLMIPFPHKDEHMNIWLTYFTEQHITIHFTTEVLYRYDRVILSNEERLEILEAGDHLMPFQYNGNWKQQKKEIHADWNQHYPPTQYDPSLNEEKKKSLFRPLSNVTLFVYAMMIGITFGLIKLSELGLFAADNPLPIFMMFFFGSLLYFFLLRNYLLWYFMLFLVVKVFLFGVVSSISFEESNTISIQISENILGASLVFPFVVWLPYLIVKQAKKKF